MAQLAVAFSKEFLFVKFEARKKIKNSFYSSK
jgi:hypothetical protein